MKKIKQAIRCVLGKHKWKESGNDGNYFDPDDYTRTCEHCGKVQIMYMGDWHTVKN